MSISKRLNSAGLSQLLSELLPRFSMSFARHEWFLLAASSRPLVTHKSIDDEQAVSNQSEHRPPKRARTLPSNAFDTTVILRISGPR